jgi:prefoldin subunit 5
MSMTIDERLDRPTGHHEALAQSLEILTADVHALQASTTEIRASSEALRTSTEALRDASIAQRAGLEVLAEIAQSHERRLVRLESA